MQFSLFGAAAIEPSRADLDGLLLGGGHWVRSGSPRSGRHDVGRPGDPTAGQPGRPGRPDTTGSTDIDDPAGTAGDGSGQERARLSVLVGPGWRVDALMDEFARRGLAGEVAEAEGGLVAVRTAFLAELVPAAERWTRGALTAPPPGLVLSAGGLRLWAIAAGHTDDIGYLLGTASLDHPVHRAAGAQLAAAGLAAVSIGERGGPGWRITGLKRVRRLAELLGEPPAGAGLAWPG